MKVKDVIDAVTNNSFYSISEVDEYCESHFGEWLRPLSRDDPSVEYLQEVDLNDEGYYLTATILYKCDDGVVGVHGLYFHYEYELEDKDFEELCTAKEYILVDKPIYVPK